MSQIEQKLDIILNELRAIKIANKTVVQELEKTMEVKE
jgi:hypothetical protein|tara:strand:+ start:3267 stop:3380 length:114 start_codon:yes stop_codon:yes gene_type:complete